MSRHFLRRIAADLLGAAVPIHDPAGAIHHVNACFQMIEQGLVEFSIAQRLLDNCVFGIRI